MTYTATNYPSGAALKRDFQAGTKIKVVQPGIGQAIKNGIVYLEGPHYPQPHKWYLAAEVTNGYITKILK